MGNKVIVIGVDGATFDIILPMIERGELPAFKDIMDKGSWSELMSTYPPHTVPAWISCSTGMNPGKLGVVDFRKDSHLTYDEGRISLSTDVKAKPLWSLLTENNKKVMVVGIPVTYPPVKVNGIMVSPVRVIETDKIETYPPELSHELVDKLDVASTIKKRKAFMEMHTARIGSKLEEFLDATVESSRVVIEKLTEVTHYLLGKYECDFGMFMLPIDALQHHLWCFQDASHPSYDPILARKYTGIISEGYKWVDRALRTILDKVGDDATVIIVSDHGFGPLHKIFYLNRWLMERGLLTLKKGKRYSFIITNVSIRGLLQRIGLGFMAKILSEDIQCRKVPVIKRKLKSLPELIDWQYTKAYATSYAININLKGREPHGIVEPEEYKDLVKCIRNELCKLEDTDTGQRVVEKTMGKEELYSGPYLEDAPDIFFFFKDPKYSARKDPFYPNLFRQLNPEDRMTGHHTSFPKGICIIKGPNIIHNDRLNNPSIMDIVPTVLYLMGESIPDGLDGRVLTEAITQEYRKSHLLVTSVPSDKGDEMSVIGDGKLTVEEEAVIKRRLSELGYIG